MKLKLKLSSNNKKIIIPIGGSDDLLGYDDNIATLVNDNANNSVNASSDLEVKRFNSTITTNQLLTYYFWDGTNFITTLPPSEFSANGLTSMSNEVRNSFYVMQVFDTYVESIQKKLHTGYLNGYDFINRSINQSALNSTYLVNNDTEFLDIYISNDFLNNINQSTVDVYVKMFFYSAQSGKFYPFTYTHPSVLIDEKGLYLKIILNLTTFKYSINPIDFYEIINSQYSQSINNSALSIPIQKPTYPLGNTFTETGNYDTI
jgi:hypothetical protein